MGKKTRYVPALVSELKQVEQYNEKLEEAKEGNLVDSGKPIKHFSEFIESHRAANLDLIDVEKIQKRLIENRLEIGEYENPILKSAVLYKDGKYIQNKLEEIVKVNKGLKRFLPKFKDRNHNLQVEYMAELLGTKRDLEPLRKRGIFSPDNFVTGSVYGMMTPIIGGAAILGGLSDLETVMRDFDNLVTISKITIPTIGFYGGAIVQGRSGITRPIQYLKTYKDNATYLDKKIEKLF